VHPLSRLREGPGVGKQRYAPQESKTICTCNRI